MAVIESERRRLSQTSVLVFLQVSFDYAGAPDSAGLVHPMGITHNPWALIFSASVASGLGQGFRRAGSFRLLEAALMAAFADH